MFRISSEVDVKSTLHSIGVKFEEQITGCLMIDQSATQGELFKVMKKLNAVFEYDADSDCFEMEVKMSYEVFMKECNAICVQMTGLDTSDFEDYDWKGEYDGDVEPGEAVTEFLINAKENW